MQNCDSRGENCEAVLIFLLRHHIPCVGTTSDMTRTTSPRCCTHLGCPSTYQDLFPRHLFPRTLWVVLCICSFLLACACVSVFIVSNAFPSFCLSFKSTLSERKSTVLFVRACPCGQVARTSCRRSDTRAVMESLSRNLCTAAYYHFLTVDFVWEL